MTNGTILLVQNEEGRRKETTHFLESCGCRVVPAENSEAALAAPTRQRIDLILIDTALQMGSGDLCSRLRQNSATGRIPIILLTEPGYAPEPSQGPAGAADDYIAKPYSAVELAARVSLALKTKELKSELERKNRLLRMLPQSGMPIIDPATGLFNRPQFEALFSKEFKRALRYKQPVSCMRIHLDGQEEGQPADEGLVKAIVALIQKTIREVDTAAWWTGEGFIVLIPNTTRDHALQAAARILVAVADHPFSRSDSKKVAMNIGVAGLPDEKIKTETKLIEAADAALLQARQFMQPRPGGTQRSFRTDKSPA